MREAGVESYRSPDIVSQLFERSFVIRVLIRRAFIVFFLCVVNKKMRGDVRERVGIIYY